MRCRPAALNRTQPKVARYYPVSPLFWSDKKVIKWDERTRYLSLYLLTSEHRNLEGLFRLPPIY